MIRRLNIGAGGDVQPTEEGWVNADIRPLAGIDVVCDARNLPFPDGHFGEVKAFDLLEHLSLHDAPIALREWHRVLKPAGTLGLRLPDLRKIAMKLMSQSFKANPIRIQRTNPTLGPATSDDVAAWLLYGDQTPDWGGTEFGSHKWGYTSVTLQRLLSETDFENISITGDPAGEDMNLYVSAVKRA